MFWTDIGFAIAVGIILSLLLVGIFGWRRGTGIGPAILFAFVIISLAAWAGGAWIEPAGPVLWGGYWLPFLLVGFFVMLFLAAVAPGGRTSAGRRDARDAVPDSAAHEPGTERDPVGRPVGPEEEGRRARLRGAPVEPTYGGRSDLTGPEPATAGEVVFGTLFWVLVVGLGVAIIVAYIV